MKTQISRRSHDPSKRYTGVYQQQGRMVTDADWNELQDIVKERLELALGDIVGDGVPSKAGIGVQTTYDGPTVDLAITPGRVYAGGAPASTPIGVGFTYKTQPDFPEAPGVPASGDVIYADVWERDVTYLEDMGLTDSGLGGDTCARTRTVVQIKRGPMGGLASIGNGLLTVSHAGEPALGAADATEIDPEERTGNYVFRFEIHSIQQSGSGTSVELKWSSENAAEAFAVGDEPEGFDLGSWVYELYDETTELHRGEHLVAAGAGEIFPKRGVLSDGYPASMAGAPTRFIRRWDGRCRLDPNPDGVWVVTGGVDRGVPLHTTADQPGFAEIIDGGVLHLRLAALEVTLDFKGGFVLAGDYWLVAVRETDDGASPIVTQALPTGILHRYVMLGTIAERSDSRYKDLKEIVAIVGIDELDEQDRAELARSLAFYPAKKPFPALAELESAAAESAGASKIGAAAVAPQGGGKSLSAGTVESQLGELLSAVNESLGLASSATGLTADEIYSNRPDSLPEADSYVGPQIMALADKLAKLTEALSKHDHDSRYYTKTEANLRYLRQYHEETYSVLAGQNPGNPLKITDPVAVPKSKPAPTDFPGAIKIVCNRTGDKEWYHHGGVASDIEVVVRPKGLSGYDIYLYNRSSQPGHIEVRIMLFKNP